MTRIETNELIPCLSFGGFITFLYTPSCTFPGSKPCIYPLCVCISVRIESKQNRTGDLQSTWRSFPDLFLPLTVTPFFHCLKLSHSRSRSRRCCQLEANAVRYHRSISISTSATHRKYRSNRYHQHPSPFHPQAPRPVDAWQQYSRRRNAKRTTTRWLSSKVTKTIF